MTARAPIRLGLLWHSLNSGNLGVGALTVSNIALIEEAAAAIGRTVEFTVLGSRETGPQYVTGPHISGAPINTRFLLSPSGFQAAIARQDCVIDIGGGDSFAGIYGARRFGFLWLTKLFTILRSKPILLAPQTIGPFPHQPWRAMAGWAMRKSDVVIARDPMSFDAIAKIAPRAQRRQAVDVAFALPFKKATPRTHGKVQIGINVSGLLFHGGYGRKNDFGLDVNYADLMTGFIEGLLARPDVEVQLLTHVVSSAQAVDDDAHIADMLAARYPNVARIPDFASPSDAKSYISGLDLLVAGRMHACIAAYSSGVPVIPVAYSRKFSGLFEGVLKYPHSVPVKGFSTDEALQYLLDVVDKRAALKAEINEGLKGVTTALDVYRAELRRFLGSVA